MPKMNKGEFAKCLAEIRACYPGAMKDQAEWLASVEAYWQCLRGYSRDQLLSMFRRVGPKYPQWLPSAYQMASLMDESGTAIASAAWPEVMKLARRSSGEHGDPVAKEAIRLMGGGKRLGQMEQAELELWGRKEFERLYAEVTARMEREGPPMLGAPDRKALT